MSKVPEPYCFTEKTHVRFVPTEEGYTRTVIMERAPLGELPFPPGVSKFFARCFTGFIYMGTPVKVEFEIQLQGPSVAKAFKEYDRLRPKVEKEEVEKVKKKLGEKRILGPGDMPPGDIPPGGAPGFRFPGMP